MVVISRRSLLFSDFYRGVDLGHGGVVSLIGFDGIVRVRRSGDDVSVGQDLLDRPADEADGRARPAGATGR